MANDPLLEQTVSTRKMAEELSKILGCSGSHRVGDEKWGPCESPRDLLKLIELGNPAFREWKKRQKGKQAVSEMLLLKQANSKSVFKTREEAEMQAVRIGCFGAHKIRQGAWGPCGSPEEYNSVRSGGNKRRVPISRLGSPVRRVVTDQRVWESLRSRGPRSIVTLPGGGLVSGKAEANDSFMPSNAMVEEAKRALKWRKEFGRGGTMVGVARARDIANRRNLSYRTVKRMKAFFDRHAQNSKAEGYRPGEKGYPSNGRIAWALWGGDAGYSWAKSIVSRVEGSSKAFVSIEEKRFYTRAKRMEYAKRGWALPDGSFPIRDVGDLRNAIQAYGLGKDQGKAKRHIMKRARALGRMDEIPESWMKREKSAKPKLGPNDPKTPAAPSERIRGSAVNKPGSAASSSEGIKLSAAVEESLRRKVKEHNEKMVEAGKGDLKVSLGALKAVWRRGAGAFSQTHRPRVGRQQWAMGRVNAFLELVEKGKPKNPKYNTDNDLLPKKHKLKS